MVEPSNAPRVVCLCGSMSFQGAMHDAAAYESLCGHIVLMPHVNMRCGAADDAAAYESLCGHIVLMPHVNMRCGAADVWCYVTESDPVDVRAALDRLHKQKIDLADAVVVVTDAKAYIGESTRSEIAYAESLGKPVEYWRWEITANGGDAP